MLQQKQQFATWSICMQPVVIGKWDDSGGRDNNFHGRAVQLRKNTEHRWVYSKQEFNATIN